MRFQQKPAAFTLCETLIALAIGTIAVSGAAALNSQQLRMVGDSRQVNAANHALQERLEQVRGATWRQITDANYVTSTFFASTPRSSAPLHQFEESISITSWPPGEGSSAALHITKAPKSAPNVVSAGSGLADERLLKIVVQLKWAGSGRVERVRELATILSNGGISRVNLPSMGPMGGGAWEDVEPTPVAEPVGEPDGEATPEEPKGQPTANPGNGDGSEHAHGAPGKDSNEGKGGTENGNSGRGNVGGTPGVK